MLTKEKLILDELHRQWNLARSAYYLNPNAETEQKMDIALIRYLELRDPMSKSSFFRQRESTYFSRIIFYNR
jgi:hypothetical protein